MRDYLDDDMALAQCFVCGRRGHLSCQLSSQALPAQKVSCYNCGEGGHTGEDCWRVRSLPLSQY